MIEIKKLKLERWGNHFRIIIPKKIIQKENFREGDEVTIFLEKKS